jgi:hypothetical protein
MNYKIATHCIYGATHGDSITTQSKQLMVIQLQLSQNNSFSINIQFHYNYTHDVMLTSLKLASIY